MPTFHSDQALGRAGGAAVGAALVVFASLKLEAAIGPMGDSSRVDVASIVGIAAMSGLVVLASSIAGRRPWWIASLAYLMVGAVLARTSPPALGLVLGASAVGISAAYARLQVVAMRADQVERQGSTGH